MIKKYLDILKNINIEEDDPTKSSLGRRWKNVIVVGASPTWFIGWETQLIQYEHKPVKPRPVVGRHICVYWNIFLWKVEINHDYYDGANCSFQFGPFMYNRHGVSCSVCDKRD